MKALYRRFPYSPLLTVCLSSFSIGPASAQLPPVQQPPQQAQWDLTSQQQLQQQLQQEQQQLQLQAQLLQQRQQEQGGTTPLFVQGQQQPSQPMQPAASGGGAVPAFLAAMPETAQAKQCTCDLPAALMEAPAAAGAAGAGQVAACHVSKVHVRQEHAGTSGLSLAEVTADFGGDAVTQVQRGTVTLTRVDDASFACLDDRLTEASLATPGGDLGEFVLALSSYLQERDPSLKPTQKMVDAMLSKYLETIPSSRPMIHCTDDRAIAHLEAQMPMENLDLRSPPPRMTDALIQRLAEVENQGDSHVRLLLKQPEWFQLNADIVPMVLRSFYSQLWEQNMNPNSPLHQAPKLRLVVLQGPSNPQAFFEVSSGELCRNGGVAPMLKPKDGDRRVLVSHLDAVSLRREELAGFFARAANATPRKVNKEKLHQRLDRHGWLALETTGSRIAAGLPFYTLTYA